MKTFLMATVTALGLAVLSTGCSDSTESDDAAAPSGTSSAGGPAGSVAPAVESINGSVSEAARTAAEGASKVADQAKAGIQDAAQRVEQAVGEAGAAAQAKFNEWMGEVRKLVDEGKGTEALQKLQSAMGNWQLTPEQQKMIDDLKKRAQEALQKSGAQIQDAAKAVGGLLQPRTPE